MLATVLRIHKRAWLLVLLSAVLQTLVFPLPNLYFLGWAAVAPLLIALLRAREPDTLVYDVVKSRNKPRTYVVYGRFKDEAAFQVHQASNFHDRLVPPIMACVEGDMDLQMLDWKS